MAVTQTTRFGLDKWGAGTDPLTRAQINADHDAIEALGAGYKQGTAAARPAASAAYLGFIYEATDTSIVSYCTGSAWVTIDPGAILKSIGTTKGDIIGFTASGTPVRRGVGSDKQILRANSANSDNLEWVTPGVTYSLFGDGSDGAVTISGNTSLTVDKFYSSLTVNNGITLTTAGYRIFCSGTVTNNGTIANPGAAGTNGTAGPGGGVGGAGGLAGNVSGGAVGGSGQGNAGTGQTSSIGGSGGAGGAGQAGAGGGGGTATAATGWRDLFKLINGYFITPTSTITFLKGGGGGGAGQWDSLGGGGGDNGGGGGGGGGLLILVAFTLVNNGTIHADGGAGGNATVGNAGGGGGGGGGAVIVITASTTTVGTIRAAGGAHGTKNGTGVNGSDGSAGTALQIQA